MKPKRDIVAYCNGMSKAEFWSLGMGDVQNLLDEALEEIERLRDVISIYKSQNADPAQRVPLKSFPQGTL